MYARVVSAQASPRRVTEIDTLQRLGESLAENAAEQPGNCGFFGLIDHSTGKVMAISLWKTPQDLEASECSGYLRRQLASAEAILGGPVIRETFEVVAHREIAAG
jgi:hypothetical protein